MRRIALLLALCVLAPAASAQYWGEQVLDKSFEQSDFFFGPVYLNPYGLGGFGAAARGLVHDPLLDVSLNPAYLATDTLGHHYGYLDFRSSRTFERQVVYPFYADYVRGQVVDVYPYPYVRAREAPEPVVSGAYLFRPFGEASRLTVGATYQLVFQDERYYSIPADIYRSQVGRSYNGDAMLEAGDIPIVDRYSGTDVMQTRGHFAAVHAAYALGPGLYAGLRLGRTLFDRDGSFGSTNLWPSRSDRESYWSNAEDRTQDYGHWDVTGGLHLRLGRKVVAGLSAGYLWGDAGQALARQDTSFSRYGDLASDRYNYYERAGRQAQTWDRDGHTVFGGADVAAHLAPGVRLQAYYRLAREAVGLASASAVTDTSYSTYAYDGGQYAYTSEYYYAVSDVRSGGGDRTGTTHTLAGALQWQVDAATRVHVGARLHHERRRVATVEDVVAYQHHYQYWDNTSNGTYQSDRDEYALFEDKMLEWNFDSRETGVQIPLYVTRRLSRTFELLFGVNRRMTSWRITDETLAVFDERVQTENGVTEWRGGFGERYHTPVELRSDVSTTVLAGLTVSPAAPFRIRVLGVPRLTSSYGDTSLDRLEWWISFDAAL